MSGLQDFFLIKVLITQDRKRVLNVDDIRMNNSGDGHEIWFTHKDGEQMMFKMAGSKYDKMAAAKGQKYFFVFVHEDGKGLKKISEIFKNTAIEASVDEVFSLDDVNQALKKVASGGSKGKTILKIS